MRRSQVAVVAVLCLLLGAVASLGAERLSDARRDNSTKLELAGGTFLARVERATRGTYTIYLDEACLTSHGTARITGVTAEKSSNVRIIGFAVGAPGAVGAANARQPLKKFIDERGNHYSGRYPKTVSTVCLHDDPYSWRPIAISVAYDGRGQTGVLMGARLTYTVNGRTKTAHTDNGYILCTGRETSAGDDRLAADLGLEEYEDINCADFP